MSRMLLDEEMDPTIPSSSSSPPSSSSSSSSSSPSPPDPPRNLNLDGKPTVIVEICRREDCGKEETELKTAVLEFLEQNIAVFVPGLIDLSTSPLAEDLESVRIDSPGQTDGIPFWQASIRSFVFSLAEDIGAEELDGEDREEMTVAIHQWELPHRDFEGLWESLHFPGHLKQQLMSYSATALLFSARNVDSNLISCNRLVLLHGPPGTGKTSLCKALAQKLAIHLSARYQYTQLLEINSHSLFSKWFSESGKLVMRLFDRIDEMAQDPEAFVCVLIDEVESLTSARQAAVSGSEPSDAVRSVNALLTQMDRLKRYPNVLVLTTSNITEAIDTAFMDRTDLKFFIGLPDLKARLLILNSCVEELRRVGLIESLRHDQDYGPPSSRIGNGLEDEEEDTLTLEKIAVQCEGMSGRHLRKLPFQAFALDFLEQTIPYPKFLGMLQRAVEQETQERSRLIRE